MSPLALHNGSIILLIFFNDKNQSMKDDQGNTPRVTWSLHYLTEFECGAHRLLANHYPKLIPTRVSSLLSACSTLHLPLPGWLLIVQVSAETQLLREALAPCPPCPVWPPPAHTACHSILHPSHMSSWLPCPQEHKLHKNRSVPVIHHLTPGPGRARDSCDGHGILPPRGRCRALSQTQED